MPQILQLAHLVQYDGVTQMKIRRGRIQPQFDTQRLAGFFRGRELLCKLGLDQQLFDAALHDGQRIAH